MSLTATPAPQPASRLTGLGLAIGVHVILVIGFAGAFVVRTPVKPPETKISVVKEEPKPRQPIDEPTRVSPHPIDIAPPVENPIQSPIDWRVPETPTATPPDEGFRAAAGPVGPAVPGPAARPEPRPLKAGEVCTRMTAPEMPAVNFAGDAAFRVMASTQAGRVTSIQIQALSSGIDSRSMRAFKGAIERALSSYECPGSVSFTQEFNFRLE